MLGGYAAQSPVGYLLDFVGLQNTLMFIALFGFTLAIVIFILIRNAPSHLELKRNLQIENLKSEPVFSTLKQVLSKPQNWYCGLYVGLINVGTWTLGGMWSNQFLTKID